MSDSIGLKLCFAGTLLAVGYTFALAPKYAMKANQNLFSLGNMMASGVLLGAGLVHQLPDAQMMLFELHNNNDDGERHYYPWAGFICGVTFSLFLILEECMHLFVGGRDEEINQHEGNDIQHNSHGTHQHHHHHSHIKDSFLPESIIRDNDKEYGTVEKPKDVVESSAAKTIDDDGGHSYHLHSVYHSQLCREQQSGDTSSTPQIPPIGICRQMSDNNTPITEHDHHHHTDHVEMHLHGSVTSSLILLVALMIHSVLAGMGLGFNSSVDATVTTFIAIIAHKMFAAYALGSTLTAAGEYVTDGIYLSMISIFAFSTPLGIIIALVVGRDEGIDDVTIACIKAAVAGTFLYIAIVEVGTKELLVCRIQANGGKSVLGIGKRLEIAKLVSFMGGYAVMAILALDG